VLDKLSGFSGHVDTNVSTRELGDIYEGMTGDKKRVGFGSGSIQYAFQWLEGKCRVKDDSEQGFSWSWKFLDRERFGGRRITHFFVPFAEPREEPRSKKPKAKAEPRPTPVQQQKPVPDPLPVFSPDEAVREPGWYRKIFETVTGKQLTSATPTAARRNVRSPEDVERDRQIAAAAFRRIQAAKLVDPPQRE
jgi:hypothetical protein